MKRIHPDDSLSMTGPATYRIIVQGDLDPEMGARLAGMSVSKRISRDGDTESILVGRLPDQGAL